MLPWEVNLSTSFRVQPFSVEMLPDWLKAHIFRFVCIDMGAYACSGSFPDYVAGFRLSSSYTTTYHHHEGLSKLDEPDTQDTAEEVGTNSWVMYSCGPLHMDEQRQDVQLEPTYSSSVPIRDVAVRIGRKQWTIGRCGERGSGISMLIARHDDDDNDCFYKYWFWH